MKTILLAEDDPFISDIYSKEFRNEGFKVDIAKDGQMALDKIKNIYPDLLVLDIDLAKVNGCEILKILRDDPKTKNLKIIVLSNYDKKAINGKYHTNIEDFGVLKYFLKVSITPEEIMKAIKEILK